MTGPFEAVLFDMDGTLVTPTLDFVGLRAELGVPEGESILDWIEGKPVIERSELHRVLDKVERKAASRTEMLPGARRMLDWLAERSIRYGILTRNSRAAWGIVSRRCGIEDIPHVVTRDEGLAKPDPKCLEPFLTIWRCSPRKIIHVGDYRYDLELARDTGMHSILLNKEGENPFPVSCDFVAASHENLQKHLATLTFR